MRKQFINTVEDILEQDDRLVLLLGDIGVFGFRNAFQRHPDRVINIGILEQSSISVAAGLAKEGFIPIFHSIAPFVVERAFEQLKDDFCYQSLGGNFVSVGASYDYAALGCTHHCPADVSLMKSLPNMQVIVPGHPLEFDTLFRQTYDNGSPTYFRLTERSNEVERNVAFGKAEVIQQGEAVTLAVVGPLLNPVIHAVDGLDVTILYYTTLSPFDSATLAENCHNGKLMVFEPFYEGTLTNDVVASMRHQRISITSIGVPRRFLTNYGTAEEHDQACGLTADIIRRKVEDCIHA
jgi:transketolase